MAVSKIYSRINFVNGKNGGTPLNGASSQQQAVEQAVGNLNKIDYALNEIDTRLVDIANNRYDSKDYALQSQSYATGDAYYDEGHLQPYREGQETDNAKYYYELNKSSVDEIRGYSESASASATLASTSAENALQSELNAKISEDNASISENNAKTSEDNAKSSEDNTKDSEDNAKESENNAKDSERNAKTSEDNSKTSELNAKESEDNAKESEINAKSSEENASTSEINAKTSEDNAKESEINAKASEDNSKDSENNAKDSEINAKTSEENASASETNARESEENARTSETNAANSLIEVRELVDGIAFDESIAKDYSLKAESYAVGTAKNDDGTDYREGQEVDNSKYYMELAKNYAYIAKDGGLTYVSNVTADDFFATIINNPDVSNQDVYCITTEFTTTNDFLVGADEDFGAYTLVFKSPSEKWITMASASANGTSTVVSDTEPEKQKVNSIWLQPYD